ncbi:MAG: PBP1A family penicillin-binding protein [SAR86 cluster bacterium]|nr:PBP1A family penicillin-binding protein [SAR86 cluster bacterium]
MTFLNYLLNIRFARPLLVMVLLILMAVSSLNIYIDSKLPDEEEIRDIELQVPLKIYTVDLKLIGEFGEKRRTALQFKNIPTHYINAVLAAEDDAFFEHSGVSYSGLIRSVYRLLSSGRIQGGGSTITMQVAGNYLTSRDVSLFRKIKDIFLAYRLERTYSKEEIFEFYVNRIFFGNRAYGIAAASEVYYGKSLNQLNLAQWAMIAALPKAPSSINPLVNPRRALSRRNWILNRMLDLNFIHIEQFNLAIEAPLTATYHGLVSEVEAPYVSETIRRFMIQQYGLGAYREGYEVYTSIDSSMQSAATLSIAEGLEEYDRRHGFRKPENLNDLFPQEFSEMNLDSQLNFIAQELERDNEEIIDQSNLDRVTNFLKEFTETNNRFPAVVLNTDNGLKVLLKNGDVISIPWSERMDWARPFINENRRGAKPKSYKDLLLFGDLVWIQEEKVTGELFLTQIPDLQGSLVSIDPNSGSIKALVGGYDFFLSKFNRAEQSSPLLGSNFKPFLYASAFSEGFTASTLINDAPIIFEDEALEEKWRPRNASGKFYGPTRLREGLLQSRNLVSVRLLRDLGVEKAISYAQKFGFDKSRLPADLSLSLGTASLSPLLNAAAYSVFANGGKAVEPYFIEEIIDRNGDVVFQREKKDLQQVIDPRIAFLISDILQEASTRGTARKVSELKRRDFAGKTGTTNDAESTWFTGYNNSLVTTVWAGFDQPRSLGNREFGSSVALPIWLSFTKEIIDQIPVNNTLPPEGLSIIKIDKSTGKRADKETKNSIFEYYLEEHTPD